MRWGTEAGGPAPCESLVVTLVASAAAGSIVKSSIVLGIWIVVVLICGPGSGGNACGRGELMTRATNGLGITFVIVVAPIKRP